MDGSTGKFSYQKCFFTSERTEYMSECRECIAPWIRRWKYENDIPKEYEVHHCLPWTFAKISEKYGEDTNWARPIDNPAFTLFHADKCELKGLTKGEHREEHSAQ